MAFRQSHMIVLSPLICQVLIESQLTGKQVIRVYCLTFSVEEKKCIQFSLHIDLYKQEKENRSDKY